MDGERLKALRADKKLTQFQLAAASGVSVRTIQAIEARRTDPRESTVKKLVAALGVQIEDLYGA